MYVLALLFTADKKRVVLMQRTRPSWQAGRVNALGGAIVVGESAVEAARREVREEAGVNVAEWAEVLVWEDAEYRMHVMRAVSELAGEARTQEDQVVFLADASALPLNVIDNLRWLVPLALDADVSFPIAVQSALAGGSGLTDRGRETE
ncbi:MAG: NUDIX domain-containing protein [Gemmatimonadota bacterium]